MKNSAILMLFALALAFGYQANAQMSKSEYKVWKKRLKSLSPEEYKKITEEKEALASQVSSLKQELSSVDDRLADKDDQIESYKKQVASLRDELAASSVKRAADPAGSINENVGVVFKVQIGAYEKKDLAKYSKNAKNFNQESADGLNKFTVGAFRDYWEADTFKKYLREMGVKDAFIVSYKDGKRVNIKEVLEGVSKS